MARLEVSKANLGTAPVFFTAISTILGAILFLRFGYAVGSVGFAGAVAIIALGHLVTLPTAMALAEIATNQKVAGGGEYYILSRSFGILIGASIGVALFLSQAISVAFYTIAFAEAFHPVFRLINERFDLSLGDPRLVSLPALLVLGALILARGADLGLKLLYGVVAVLFLSLLLFFLGGNGEADHSAQALIRTVDNPDPFFLVFAICFPAFTGMTAGVGLSGDLKNPSRSIPVGTLAATIFGMLMYVGISYKLALSATPEDLVADQFVMGRIAVWGPIIPIGLACATVSSAIGSALVAPRTLQALGHDGIFPLPPLNRWLATGRGDSGEPVNATVIVFAIALFFVAIGDVNIVAQIISMFFMVTYGSICTISFLEHFSADPSYRPVFRSRWYISLLGAVMCLWLMFKMSAGYALLSIVVMVGLYLGISSYCRDRAGLAALFRGAIFQVSRQLQVFLQKSGRIERQDRWRPSVVCISSASFERRAAFDLLRWISYRYGFGTYIHYIEGYLSRSTAEESQSTLERLVRLADVSSSRIYVDTMVSPSYTTAICQVAQIPGISGKENNTVLFEYARRHPEKLNDIVDNYKLLVASGFDVCILGSTERDFGYRSEIHVWITAADFDNASLMILLAYIILGHPEWRRGVIKLFAIYPAEELEEQRHRLLDLVRSGRLPISSSNIQLLTQESEVATRSIISDFSREADLTILGFVGEQLQRQKADLFAGYDALGNVLFVNTTKEIEIDERESEELVGGAAETLEGHESKAESNRENAPHPP